jgi:hypothetical protein
MEMDFKEPLFAAMSVMKKVRSRGLQERAMSKPSRKRTKHMEVQIMFEPSRLQENCLHHAYRCLVPVLKRPLLIQTTASEASSQGLAPTRERNMR